MIWTATMELKWIEDADFEGVLDNPTSIIEKKNPGLSPDFFILHQKWIRNIGEEKWEPIPIEYIS